MKSVTPTTETLSLTGDPVEKIATALLYEGYVLWPYRRSAPKNQRRWTLGGVYPRDFSEAAGAASSDPWQMQTQCLVQGDAPTLTVKVRFLHVVERRAARPGAAAGEREFVDELRVGDERYLSWEEAAEREVALAGLRPAELAAVASRRTEIAIPAGADEEMLVTAEGGVAGALVRGWEALRGAVAVGAEPAGDGGLYRVTVRITNTAPWDGSGRESALRRTFVSTHTVLTVAGGEFVSLLEPPAGCAEAAAACENIKTWPVLVGSDGDRTTLLSSPIILYDYPKIAPESPGDFFDGGEIDQLLVLNILTLTDAEKAEIRASDPRAREILERTERLSRDDLMRLHGTIREFRILREEAADETGTAAGAMPDLFAGPEQMEQRPVPQSVPVGGVPVRKGSRVRLRPRAGADIFDIALAGKVGIVEAIEQDYEDHIHFAVTVEDDPGRDLGEARFLGHRWFFSPEEVEPL